MRVLLVDDEPDILEQAEIFLRRENDYFEIETTTSPEQALSYIEGDNFDAVVSDYQMPGKDGLELLKEVRSKGADAPFIIFTGRGREAVAMRALNLGADHYLQKSGEPSTQYKVLSHMIEKAVGYREARRMEEFLHTLLRQDLRSKNQIITGYLELLDDADLTEEDREHLNSARNKAKRELEIIEEIKKLKEIYENETFTEKRIGRVLDNVIEELNEMIEEDFEVEVNQENQKIGVMGDYSLNRLFIDIITTRIRDYGSKRIRIEMEQLDGNNLVRIEDDGERLPKEVKDLFTGEIYKGRTTGAVGVRYSIAAMIAKHNHGGIEVKDSELGGASFDVHLRKVQEGDARG